MQDSQCHLRLIAHLPIRFAAALFVTISNGLYPTLPLHRHIEDLLANAGKPKGVIGGFGGGGGGAGGGFGKRFGGGGGFGGAAGGKVQWHVQGADNLLATPRVSHVICHARTIPWPSLALPVCWVLFAGGVSFLTAFVPARHIACTRQQVAPGVARSTARCSCSRLPQQGSCSCCYSGDGGQLRVVVCVTLLLL